MTLWEELETFLVDNDYSNSSFTVEELAAAMGLPEPAAATRLIQAYLGAQTAKESKTLFVLHRTGRTKTAVWHVGVRTADAIELNAQVGDDLARRIERFAAPSLHGIGTRNPRARQTTDALTTILEGTAQLLTAGGEDGQRP